MRLFISSLQSGESSPPSQSWAEDGGECIHLTPDALGGDYEFTGKGVTCTGLDFHGWSLQGHPQFWVVNEGRDREPGAGGIDPQVWLPSILLVELDYSASGGGASDRVTGTKLKDLRCESFRAGTIQGVCEANDGTLYFAGGNIIYHIEPDNDANGDAVLLDTWSVTSGLYISGLTYDYSNDTLLIFILGGGNTWVNRYSRTGTLIDANVVEIHSQTDQLFLDIYDPDVLWVGLGGNGSSAVLREYSISGAFASDFTTFPNNQAGEGCAVVKHPVTGTVYGYTNGDGWYHQLPITNPDFQINAIHKKAVTRRGGDIYDGNGNLL